MIYIKKGENKMDYKKDDCSKTISFGRITGSRTDAETVIFDYDRYELGNSKRCFPSVKNSLLMRMWNGLKCQTVCFQM